MAVVLVTGATGYVGANIVAELVKRGHDKVVAAVRNEWQIAELGSILPKSDRLSFRVGNLPENPWLLEGVDTVVHCSGSLVGAKLCELYRVNVQGTEVMLRTAFESGVGRFLQISSQSVYGFNRAFSQDELLPPQPGTMYAFTKFAAEQLLQSEELFGVQTLALRVPRIYGKGLQMRSRLLPHVFARLVAQEKKLPIFMRTRNSICYLHIKDLACAVCKAVSSSNLRTADIINVGSETALTNLELAAICRNVALQCGLSEPPLELIDKGTSDSIAAGMRNERAQQTLGWRPKIKMHEGMLELVQAELYS